MTTVRAQDGLDRPGVRPERRQYLGALLRGDTRSRAMTDGDDGTSLLYRLDDAGLTATTLDALDAASQPSETSAERYSAWADRFRDKRAREQATIRGNGVPGDGVSEPGANWAAAAVRGDQ